MANIDPVASIHSWVAIARVGRAEPNDPDLRRENKSYVAERRRSRQFEMRGEPLRQWFGRGGVFSLPVVVLALAVVLTDQVWQDYLLLFGTLVISVVMVPTLLDADASVPRMTSVPGAFAVFLFVIAFASLELWLTAIANAVSFLLWVLVAVLRAP